MRFFNGSYSLLELRFAVYFIVCCFLTCHSQQHLVHTVLCILPYAVRFACLQTALVVRLHCL